MMILPEDYVAIMKEAERAGMNGDEGTALWIDLAPYRELTNSIKALLQQVKLPYYEVGELPTWQAKYVVSRKKYGFSQDIITFCSQIVTSVKIIDGVEAMAGGADNIFIQHKAVQ